MATDLLLLQRYPEPAAARFRHYDWRVSACTFGYSQKIAFVHTSLAANPPRELCRRPTGGGIVDHRDDWTYTLVLPRGHPLADAPAPVSYEAVHACLARVLVELGCGATLQPGCQQEAAPAGCAAGPGVCFQRAEPHDVILASTGAKIAGAAQKRTKHGLLCQGSLARAVVGTLDWDALALRFPAALAQTLNLTMHETGWPDFQEDELAGLTERYAAPEWNEAR